MTQQNGTPRDTAFPCPYFDELPGRPIFEDLRNRRELEASTLFWARNYEKDLVNIGLSQTARPSAPTIYVQDIDSTGRFIIPLQFAKTAKK